MPVIPVFPIARNTLHLKYAPAHIRSFKYHRRHPVHDKPDNTRPCIFNFSDPQRYNKPEYISSEADPVHDRRTRLGACEVQYHIIGESSWSPVLCYELEIGFKPNETSRKQKIHKEKLAMPGKGKDASTSDRTRMEFETDDNKIAHAEATALYRAKCLFEIVDHRWTKLHLRNKNNVFGWEWPMRWSKDMVALYDPANTVTPSWEQKPRQIYVPEYITWEEAADKIMKAPNTHVHFFPSSDKDFPTHDLPIEAKEEHCRRQATLGTALTAVVTL